MDKHVLIEFLKRPIAYHPIIAKAFRSVQLAVLWSQLYYWSDRGHDKDGWVYKTQEEMYEETGMKRSSQETARRLGKKLGLIEEDRRGSPGKIYFKIDLERAIELISEFEQQKNNGKLFRLSSPKKKGKWKIKRITTVQKVKYNEEFFSMKMGAGGYDDIVGWIKEKYGNTDEVINEMRKFVLYWTEKNPGGTKARWEMQKVFDIKRRIVTWMSNTKKFSSSNKKQGITV